MRSPRSRTKWAVLAGAGLSMAVGASDAQAITVLAKCGPSSGYAYYFPMGIVASGREGWQKEEAESTHLTVIMNDENRVDLWQSEPGGLRSYLKDKINVILTGGDRADRALILTATGSNFVATYLFRLDEKGVGRVTWTTSSFNQSITKSSLMTAECGPQFTLVP